MIAGAGSAQPLTQTALALFVASYALSADEIAGQIVSALERRIATMQDELRKLGVATAA